MISLRLRMPSSPFPHHHYPSLCLSLGSTPLGSLNPGDSVILGTTSLVPLTSHQTMILAIKSSHVCTSSTYHKPAQKGTDYMHTESFLKKESREEALMFIRKLQEKFVFANYSFRVNYTLRYIFLRLQICQLQLRIQPRLKLQT